MVKLVVIFVLLLSTQLWAQNPEEDPNNAQGAAVPAPQNIEEEPMVEGKSIQAYLAPFYYDEDQYRNPFLHPELAIPLIPGEIYGPFLSLQQYRLNQLKVTGLFWNTAKPKAFVKIPGGETLSVGIKDYIGENFGYIASIREKEIVIIQTLEEQGQRYTTTKVLFLSKNTGSGQ